MSFHPSRSDSFSAGVEDGQPDRPNIQGSVHVSIMDHATFRTSPLPNIQGKREEKGKDAHALARGHSSSVTRHGVSLLHSYDHKRSIVFLIIGQKG